MAVCVHPQLGGRSRASEELSCPRLSVDSWVGAHDITPDASINDNVTMALGATIEAAFDKPGHGVLLPG